MSGAVYLDLDGTLLDPGGLLVRASLETVAAVRERGLRPVVLTGRSRWAAAAIAGTLGIGDVVCELGAVALVDGRPVADDAEDQGAVHRATVLDALGGLPLQEHEPGVPRARGLVLRSAAPAGDVTAALRAAGEGRWWAVDNGPSHRPLDDGRACRVVHVLPAGTDKTTGVRRHLLRRGLDADACAVVGDSPADLACRTVVARTVAVRSDDREAQAEAVRLGLPTTAAHGAAGALEAVRGLPHPRR